MHAIVTGDDEFAALCMTLNEIFEERDNVAEKTLYLDERHQVLVYHNSGNIILQMLHEVPPDGDPLLPSFRVAVALSPEEVTALASELMRNRAV